MPATRLVGPVVVDEGTSTTVVSTDQQLAVDDHGHLVITGGAR